MWETFRKKVVCTYSMGKIRSRIKPFKAVDFARTAQEMFFEVNEALAKNNKQRLQELMRSRTSKDCSCSDYTSAY
jgi:hypothetical protein